MLTAITLRNFKCYREQIHVDLKKLNLLTGINGKGKSTLLQALLLMRQSPEYDYSTTQVIFNGSCVELGRFDDVRNNDVSPDEPIEVGLYFEESEQSESKEYIIYSFTRNEQDDLVGDVSLIRLSTYLGEGLIERNGDSYIISDEGSKSEPVYFQAQFLSLFGRNFAFLIDGEISGGTDNLIDLTRIHYVSADRFGPQETYPKKAMGEFSDVGRRGEYAPNILYQKQLDHVAKPLQLSHADTITVIDQTKGWLNEIFGGGHVDTKEIEDANLVVLKLNADDSPGTTYRPSNVGFGYSYALPIIVSGLIAKPGEILIVENPEAHLHPYAQAQMAKFLARVSASGVQVFIESHSETILNGLRIAVLDGVVTADDLNILYFSKAKGKDVEVEKIPVQNDEYASIEHWPEGFFDQNDKDLQRLFGI